MKKIEFHRFHKYIVAMIFFKIIIMGLCSSGYQNDLFMPFTDTFVNSFIQGEIVNPYSWYYNLGKYDLFPYPPFMLWMVCVGSVLKRLSFGSLFMSNFLFKLPLLFFDFLGMYWLVKMFPERRKYTALLYFSSPIVIYATYMHGQLDIIPTVLLIGAMYYYIKPRPEQPILASVLLGFALASKFHIAAVFPILCLFIYKRDGIRKAMAYMGIALLTAAIFIVPFWGTGFINCVIMNPEQAALTVVFMDYGIIKLYLPILVVLMVYLKTFTISSMNKDLLCGFMGVLFALFLALTAPMPGWYIWVVPYITIFFISVNVNRYRNMLIYFALNIAYLLYFIFIHNTKYVGLYLMERDLSYLKIQHGVIPNIVFTVLTGLLIYSVYMLYQLGVASNSYYRKSIPFTIGITGDSGSGKSRFLNILESVLGAKNMLYIEGDGDHKWERGDENWESFTHLNPKANYIYRQAADLRRLYHGEHIKRVDYDHVTGHFTEAEVIHPKPYTVLCGLHALYLPQTRKNLDLKIYMNIDENLRRYWKIQRDTNKRGYSKETILKQIEARMTDAEKYIYPQKQYADILIRYFDPTLSNYMEENHVEQLGLELVMSSSVDMEDLIEIVARYKIQVQYDYSDDLKKQMIVFTGEGLSECTLPLNRVASTLIPRLDEITRQHLEPEDNLHAIIQMAILFLIDQKMQGDELC